MAELPEVLTTSESIEDTTPKVNKLEKDVANIKAGKVQEGTVEAGPVSQEQHSLVEQEIARNKEDIKDIRRGEVTQVQHQNVLDQIKDIREGARTAVADAADAAKKIIETARIAAQEVQTINQGRPIAPTTTAEEDITTAGIRKNASIWNMAQAVIAILVTAAVVFISIYQTVVPSSTTAFPVVLAAAMGAVITFFFQKVAESNKAGVTSNFESRAQGGRVSPGEGYIVGERGRERFYPEVPGTVEKAKPEDNPPKPL